MKKNKKINIDEANKYEQNIKDSMKLNKKTIFERFTVKENILIFSIILILLIIANNFVKNINVSNTKLNYKNLTAEQIIENSQVSYDREVYWRLNAILRNVLSAGDKGNHDYDANIDLSYYKYSSDQYYKYLTNEYKKNISKIEFKNKLNKVIQKAMYLDLPIEKVYKYDNSDFYLVKLKSNEASYVGIKLMSDSNTYYIFYLE